jgi:pimeloyl-ACP methyl ester carboxylesterase
VRLFEYERSSALDVQEVGVTERDGARIHDLSFASPVSGRVTALLVEPARAATGEGSFAGIVFGHWGPGDRAEFLPEATLYAAAGAVSVLVDYPWKRPSPEWRDIPGPSDPEGTKAVYVQAVVDLRRALDLRLAREDVDPARVGYVGHSYGAQWGAILGAVDERVKAAVLMAGIPDMSCIWVDSTEPGFVEYRKSLEEGALARYVEVVGALDAVRFVPHAAPTPLFFQFATLERDFDVEDMRRYVSAASEPKSVLWYETGHELNDPRALRDRAAWLGERIGIAPIRWP